MGRVRRLAGVFLAAGVVGAIGSPQEASSVSVSRTEAIEVARHHVIREGVMALDGREPVVKGVAPRLWHVSFPLVDEEVLGGEPHVLVRKKDGVITDVYYTQ